MSSLKGIPTLADLMVPLYAHVSTSRGNSLVASMSPAHVPHG